MEGFEVDPYNIEELPEIEDIEEIEESDEDFDEEIQQGAPKRYIRDFENPFERYTEKEFKLRFRFNKDVVMNYLLPKIVHRLQKRNKRGLPIPPEMHVLITLRFYATGTFQAVYGDLTHVAQSTVSRVVTRVSSLFASLMRDVIKMPTTAEDIEENRRVFREIGTTRNTTGIPGVDRAIDCTHIKLVNTRFQKYQEVYRNRKGYFSLNVQAVVGPRLEFLDLVPEWAGSMHDSRILQNSRIYMRYREGLLSGFLLGDAGYLSLPFLFTPVANPGSRAEEKYNYVHSRTRMFVERAFGVWKRRFPCLSRGLGNKLACSTSIVVACTVLHNFSRLVDAESPDDAEGAAEDEQQAEDHIPMQEVRKAGEGFAVRRALIERLFT